jgi:hypothetical protein
VALILVTVMLALALLLALGAARGVLWLMLYPMTIRYAMRDEQRFTP